MLKFESQSKLRQMDTTVEMNDDDDDDGEFFECMLCV